MDTFINVFEFKNYKVFLRAWLGKAKKEKRSNLSKLAEICGVHPTFLSHVLRGTKDLSLEQASLISEHLNFTQIEQEYFFSIIQMERAGHHKLKKYYQEKIEKIEVEKNKLSQRFEKHKDLNIEERVIFYSSWIYSAVWVSTDINKGQMLDEVAMRFQLNRDKAQEILSFLVRTGLCKENAGIYNLGEAHVHVPNETYFVVKHHTNYRVKAIQRMDNRESNELFFTSPMSISTKDFDRIREKLNLIIKEIVEIAKNSESEKVVCFNIDFFRMD